MNEKWNNFNNLFKDDYKSDDKYIDYNKLLKKLDSSSYDIDDILDQYRNNMWTTYKPKKDETPQEREVRLLGEKAKAREAKIDLILKK